MNGFLDIPNRKQQRVWLYTTQTVSSAQGLQVWNKPPGAKFVCIVTIGTGGGGGGGQGNDGTNLVYGASGGSSAASQVNFLPAHMVPDRLYVQVGNGGAGGTGTGIGVTGNAGSNGQATSVIWSLTGGIALYFGYAVGGNGGPGGRQGLGSGASGGGANPTATAITQIGARTGWNGQASIGAGTTRDITTSPFRCTSGASGARWGTGTTTTEGGHINFPPGDACFQRISGGANNSGEPGSSLNDLMRFYATGGSGGAVNRTGVAGVGGNAGFGSGGGGGAAGNPNGSTGGKGGDGLVLIICS